MIVDYDKSMRHLGITAYTSTKAKDETISYESFMDAVELVTEPRMDAIKRILTDQYGIDFDRWQVVLPELFCIAAGIQEELALVQWGDVMSTPFLEDGKMLLMDKSQSLSPRKL